MSNILAYCQGTTRYRLYYSKRWCWLIPRHIRQQIAFRIMIMDKECYCNGSCKICGCHTTALQMADKACDKPCYPPMMSRRFWEIFACDLVSSGLASYRHVERKHGEQKIYIYDVGVARMDGGVQFKVYVNSMLKHTKFVDSYDDILINF